MSKKTQWSSKWKKTSRDQRESTIFKEDKGTKGGEQRRQRREGAKHHVDRMEEKHTVGGSGDYKGSILISRALQCRHPHTVTHLVSTTDG